MVNIFLMVRRFKLAGNSNAQFVVRLFGACSPASDGLRQLLKNRHRLRKTDARISHRYAMLQSLAGNYVLSTFVQMAFNHQTHDADITCCDLRGHIGSDGDLAGMLLAAVGV